MSCGVDDRLQGVRRINFGLQFDAKISEDLLSLREGYPCLLEYPIASAGETSSVVASQPAAEGPGFTPEAVG